MTSKLKVATPTEREIVVTREFNAPRNLVWQAMSDPAFIKRWLSGPPGWSMTACDDDLSVGGKFRWTWRGPDGAEMTIAGVYREIVPLERIVRSETFEMGCAPQAGEQIGTLVLTDHGTKTTMTLTVLYPSKEARDGAVASGMEYGMEASYVQLDAMLASA